MDSRELTEAIHRRLRLGIKTNADREECLVIDEKWRNFIETASEEKVKEFEQRTIGLEAFAMIVEGIKYERDKEKYLAELAQMEHIG